MKNFPSKIFIDGGEPEETKKAKELLGYLDGQTTNPSLIAKNLGEKIQQRLTQDLALMEYKRIVQEMAKIIPIGSISIQVFANMQTDARDMIIQARERRKWIINSSIKIPCTKEGLAAAEVLCREMPINITLVFSQSQAAAVYEATKGAVFPVFISPFVGRLDDKGDNGMEIIRNILKMYNPSNGGGDDHVEVLTASVRNLDHIYYALFLESPIITIPFKTFLDWKEDDFSSPPENYIYPAKNLKEIPYDEKITLGKNWQEYDLHHDLTEKGVERFWDDWRGLFR